MLLSKYTKIHINYLESTQKLIKLKQKFLHSDVVAAGQQFNYNQLATSSVESSSTKRRITDCTHRHRLAHSDCNMLAVDL